MGFVVQFLKLHMNWLALLEHRHRLVMGGRPDKRPGQSKEKLNQAGSYVFVVPALLEGPCMALDGWHALAGSLCR